MDTWLNPALDPAPFAAAFARVGRVRIPGILVPAMAERLHTCLAEETPWRLVFNDGPAVTVLDRARLAALGPQEVQRMQRAVLSRARDRFQFLYNSYPMLDAYREGRDPGLFLHALFEALNSAPVLEFVRAVTGIPGIVKGDAQATLYRPGHFLTLHDDRGDAAEHRRVAYVLNMTRGWTADWGGLLQFYGADGGVEEGWVPAWNTLALFRVPAFHAVSYVAPYAGTPRLSVTGWWRDG